MKHEDQSGKQYGRWTLIKRANHPVRPHYLCRCSCGTEKVINFNILRMGTSKSCGCYRSDILSERNTKHGMYKTSEYKIWNGLNDRCSNPKNIGYPNYGNRGITVCKRWCRNNENGFINFINDMGNRPSKLHSIDRIDSNKGYCSENCRWATSQEQGYNRRTNVIVNYNGKSMCIKELADILKVSHGSLLNRYKYYKNIDDVLASYKVNPYKSKL